jgi:hypothetical protein
MECAACKRHSAFHWPVLTWLFARMALACDQPSTMREATSEEVRAVLNGKNMTVLTFLGYSGAEYENKAAMLEHATQTLDQFDPRTTIVSIGATPEGIGAVYEIAKRQGFLTAGIVPSQAQEHQVKLSPCVDLVFFVRDATWGGFIPGTERLSRLRQR